MTIPIVNLKKKEERRIASGHLWVFSNEIETIEGTPSTGDVVQVKSKSNESLGYGFYNPKTLIAVRIYSKKFIEPDAAFFNSRLTSSLRLRESLFKTPFYRLAYSESDFLPGLIIDRFGPVFSVQIFSAAMEKRKDLIFGVLKDLFSPAGIYERNESSTRELEGLPQVKSIAHGEEQSVEYDEEGVLFGVAPFRGQKTGFYYDQRLNRIFSRRFAPGAEVLDLYSNEGGFGLNMAFAGAKKVTSVDSSEFAIDQLKLNTAKNGLANVDAILSDVHAYLDSAAGSGRKYDVVVCDPPSFTRNRKSVTTAKAGYRRLHESVFRVLKPGGIVLTASCSHHIFRETFEEVVAIAAQKSDRTLQLLQRAGASPDHPTLPAMPETEYLKFNIYRVL
jgi:23S rRNA (cytosine1962-C5)-methyltransferase